MTIEIRPTLIIGIGGTGGDIAELLYEDGERLGLVERRLLSVISLDTDDNDHRKRRLKETHKVRFSKASRIADLMRDNPEAAGTAEQPGWFYHNSELSAPILNMSLMDGAGQVRMFSRLALHDGFRRGTVENGLRSSLTWLTTVSNRAAYQGQINVFIISSLAGGTGCGSFLQVALAIRDIAAQNSITKTYVRGLFLLPDVYVRGAGLGRDQIANVTTNGYAALRELNAVMQATSGNIDLDAFDLEFMPGKRLKKGQMPFDVITLIDYEMTNGRNLGPNLQHYKDLLGRAAQTQLFLPLGQEVDQRSVNSVQLMLAGVEKGTTNSYASLGVFSITYPEEAVLHHLTTRFAIEVLEGDWLILDRSYRRSIESYEERRRAGDLSVRFPDRGERFIADLEQFARDRRPLFAGIYQNVYKEEQQPDGGTELKVSYAQFQNAFEAYVLAQLRNENERIREAYGAGYVTASQLSEQDDLPDIVRRRERILDNTWNVLEDAARQVPDGLYDNYWAGGLTMGESEWQEHHLQKYLVASAPHLVEVRYFLYCLVREIDKRLQDLKPEDFYRSVQEASVMFEDNRRPVEGRRAGPGTLLRAEEIAAQGLMSRLLSSKKTAFANQYTRYYRTSLDNMRQYAEAATLQRCYERLKIDVGNLLRLLELLFSDLEALQSELRQELAADRNQHASTVGAQSGNRYVFAGPDAKDAMWNDIAPNVQGQKIGEQANSRLVRALFDEVLRRRSARTVDREQQTFSVRRLFHEVIVEGFCRKTLREDLSTAYSFNVAAAIKKEAALQQINYETHITELVHITANQARPFVQVVDEQAGTELVYWAMHPETRQEIGSAQFLDELFRYHEAVSAVDGEEYDRRTLLCVDVKFNFPLLSLAKLQPGTRNSRSTFDSPTGRYDAYYREWIDKVLESEARGYGRVRSKLNPHLDRNWHKPTALPEIFAELEVQSSNQLYQDFVIAYGLGYLRKETEVDEPVVVFYDPTKRDQGGSRTVVLSGQGMGQLLMMFKSRPDLARSTQSGFEKELEVARRRAETEDYRSLTLVSTLASAQLLADLLEVAGNRQLSNPDGEAASVTKAHFEVLKTLIQTMRSQADPARVRRDFHELLATLTREGLALLAPRIDGDIYKQIQHIPGHVAQAVEN